MKILIFTHIFPYPLDEGGRTAQFNFIEQAALEHEIILVPLISELEKSVELEFLRLIKKGRVEKILFKDNTPNHTFIQKVVRKLIWWLRKVAPKEEDTIINNRYFLNPVRVRSEEVVLQIEQLILKHQPEIIQVDFIDNADLGCIIPPTFPACLILHDLRSESIKQYSNELAFSPSYQTYLSTNVANKESPFLRKFDSIITFNTHEAEIVREWNANVNVNPFPVNKRHIDSRIQPGEVQKLVFLGSSSHFPNLDGLRWYCEAIGKTLSEKYQLDTEVIGRWNKNVMEEFRNTPFLSFRGFVYDLFSKMQNCAMIVPLKIGSGIRTKILDAFAMGIPVISSSIGMQGIPALPEVHYLKADNLEEYEKAVDILLNKEDIVMQMRKAARKFVEEFYSQEKMVKKRVSIYESIIRESDKIGKNRG